MAAEILAPNSAFRRAIACWPARPSGVRRAGCGGGGGGGGGAGASQAGNEGVQIRPMICLGNGQTALQGTGRRAGLCPMAPWGTSPGALPQNPTKGDGPWNRIIVVCIPVAYSDRDRSMWAPGIQTTKESHSKGHAFGGSRAEPWWVPQGAMGQSPAPPPSSASKTRIEDWHATCKPRLLFIPLEVSECAGSLQPGRPGQTGLDAHEKNRSRHQAIQTG